MAGLPGFISSWQSGKLQKSCSAECSGQPWREANCKGRVIWATLCSLACCIFGSSSPNHPLQVN